MEPVQESAGRRSLFRTLPGTGKPDSGRRAAPTEKFPRRPTRAGRQSQVRARVAAFHRKSQCRPRRRRVQPTLGQGTGIGLHLWSAGPTLHYGARDWFVTVSYQRQLANARVYDDGISDWLYQGRIYGDEATRNEL